MFKQPEVEQAAELSFHRAASLLVGPVDGLPHYMMSALIWGTCHLHSDNRLAEKNGSSRKCSNH